MESEEFEFFCYIEELLDTLVDKVSEGYGAERDSESEAVKEEKNLASSWRRSNYGRAGSDRTECG